MLRTINRELESWKTKAAAEESRANQVTSMTTYSCSLHEAYSCSLLVNGESLPARLVLPLPPPSIPPPAVAARSKRFADCLVFLCLSFAAERCDPCLSSSFTRPFTAVLLLLGLGQGERGRGEGGRRDDQAQGGGGRGARRCFPRPAAASRIRITPVVHVSSLNLAANHYRTAAAESAASQAMSRAAEAEKQAEREASRLEKELARAEKAEGRAEREAERAERLMEQSRSTEGVATKSRELEAQVRQIRWSHRRHERVRHSGCALVCAVAFAQGTILGRPTENGPAFTKSSCVQTRTQAECRPSRRHPQSCCTPLFGSVLQSERGEDVTCQQRLTARRLLRQVHKLTRELKLAEQTRMDELRQAQDTAVHHSNRFDESQRTLMDTEQALSELKGEFAATKSAYGVDLERYRAAETQKEAEFQSKEAQLRSELEQLRADTSQMSEIKTAHDSALSVATKFETVQAKLNGLLDLTDIDAAAASVSEMVAAVALSHELKETLTQLKEQYRAEIEEKDAIMKEFAETTAMELATRDQSVEDMRASREEVIRRATDIEVNRDAQTRSASEEMQLMKQKYATTKEALAHATKTNAAHVEQLKQRHTHILDTTTQQWQGYSDKLKAKVKELRVYSSGLKVELAKRDAHVTDMHSACMSIQREMNGREERLRTERENRRKELTAWDADADAENGAIQNLKEKFETQRAELASEFAKERSDWNAEQRETIEKFEEAVTKDRETFSIHLSKLDTQKANSPVQNSGRSAKSSGSSASDRSSFENADTADEKDSVALGILQSMEQKLQEEKAQGNTDAHESFKQQKILSERIQSLHTELQDVHGELARTRQALIQKNNETDSYRSQLSEATLIIDKRDQKVESLQTSAEQAKKMWESLREEQGSQMKRQISARVSQIDALKVEIETMASALKEAQVEVLKSREDQIEHAMKRQQMESDQQNEATRSANSADASEFQTVQSALSAANTKLVEANTIIESVRVEAITHKQSITTAEQKTVLVIQQLTSLRSSAESTEQELKQSRTELQTLRQQLVQSASATEMAASEATTARKAARDAEDAVIQREQQIEALRALCQKPEIETALGET